jgi:hypothetical protein
MGTASGMIKEARGWLGTTEHPPGSNYNEIVRRYNAEVDHIGRGPWCDMEMAICAIDSDNVKACGTFAWTVAHAQWFKDEGRFHYGTKGIRPGDVIFFNWVGSHSIPKIDHVGIVERVEHGVIYTIEGNKGDKCVREERDATYVVGYGRPAYSRPKLVAPNGTPLLRRGQVSARAGMLQRCLNKVYADIDLAEDNDFGPKTEAALKTFQANAAHKDKDGKKLVKDGEYGEKSEFAMQQAIK